MRPSYSTITPTTVHSLARSVLERTLQFQPHKPSVPLPQRLDRLLVVAATARTLFAIAERSLALSHETARQTLHDNLPPLEVLTRRLADALDAVAEFSRRDRRRHWSVARDTHNVPYYGARSTPHVVGGQKKRGTKYFFSYATAVLIHRRRRYTVGLLSVAQGLKPHEQVATLLEQVTSRGLRIGGVVRDAGFDSGETILLVQGMKVSCTVPLRRKGNGTNRRDDCLREPSGTLGTVGWVTEKTRKPVSTRVYALGAGAKRGGCRRPGGRGWVVAGIGNGSGSRRVTVRRTRRGVGRRAGVRSTVCRWKVWRWCCVRCGCV